MKQKLFTLLVAITASMGAMNAEVYSGTCGADTNGSNITWSLNTEDSTIIIDGVGEMKSYNYSHAPWYDINSYIKTIEIKQGVTTIGNSAFANCFNLKSVSIHGALSQIGTSAFYNCDVLDEVYIDSLAAWCQTYINEDYGSSPLSYGAHLYVKDQEIIDLVIPDGLTSTARGVFYYWKHIQTLTIPESMTSLTGFKQCEKLHKVVWNATNMNDYEYSGTTPFYSPSIYGNYDLRKQIDTLVFGANVSHIPANLCSNWSSGTKFFFTNPVIPTIGANAFYHAYVTVYFPCGLVEYFKTNLKQHFDNYGVTYLASDGNNPYTLRVEVEDTNIGKAQIREPLDCNGKATIVAISIENQYQFSHWNDGNTDSVRIVENITSDTTFTAYYKRNTCGESLYWGIYGDTLKVTGTGAMYNYAWNKSAPWSDKAYTVVNISEGVQTIGDYAFSQHYTLTSINIPNSITSIGSFAFSNCGEIHSCNIPNSVVEIKESAFSGSTQFNVLYLPSTLTSYVETGLTADTIYYNGTLAQWCNIDFSTLNANPCAGSLTYNHTYTIVTGGKSGSYYNDSNFKCKTILYINGEKVENITFGAEVYIIKQYAFAGCASLISVEYTPEAETEISASAFYGCAELKSMELRNSNIIFWGNEKISRIIWNVSGIINYNYRSTPFYHGSSNIYKNEVTNTSTKYYDISQKITQFIIGDRVSYIPDYLCYDFSSVDSIVIPCGVDHVSDRAFNSCSAEIVFHNVIPGVYIDSHEESDYASGRIHLTSYTDNDGYAAYDYAILNDDTTKHYKKNDYISRLTKGEYKLTFFSNSGCPSKEVIVTINRYAMRYKDCYYILNDESMLATVTFRGESYDSYIEYYGNITIPKKVMFGEKEYTVYGIGSNAFRGCNELKSITLESDTPIYMDYYDAGFENPCIAYVPYGSMETYKSNWPWNLFTLHVFNPEHISSQTYPTGATITIGNAEDKKHIVSCGIMDSTEFAGDILELIGLNPNYEYTDIPLFIKTNEGDYDTLHYSFKTDELTLMTKESKPVSSTTAILLAETNMSDAETNCGFEYKRNDAPEDFSPTKVFSPVSGGTMAGRLKNLKDDIYYKYRAFYQSKAGNTYYGEWQYIFTGDITVEFDPILYTYEPVVVSKNKVILKGYALAGSEDFTEQGFEYWAESRVPKANAPLHMQAALGEHHFVTATGISMSVTLDNLDAGTVYKYRVYAKVGNEILYGSEMSFTTDGEYEGTEDIENSYEQPAIRAHKFIRDGQIFIQYGDKVYTITGQEVK